MKMKMKLLRWSAAFLSAGYLLQVGSCALDQETISALISQVAVRQASNFVSDVIFFLLDNALVRMTG